MKRVRLTIRIGLKKKGGKNKIIEVQFLKAELRFSNKIYNFGQVFSLFSQVLTVGFSFGKLLIFLNEFTSLQTKDIRLSCNGLYQWVD